MSAIIVPTAPAVPPTLNGVARLTLDQFFAKYPDGGAELVKGVVKEVPMAWQRHGKRCVRAIRLLGRYLDDHDIGHLTSNDSWIQTGPDSVRGPDICFFLYDRLPAGELPDRLLTEVPNFVIEVRSPSDRMSELLVKFGEYLSAGVTVVVMVDPSRATVTVYRDDGTTVLSGDDLLEFPDILSGFSVRAADLFV